MIHSPLSDLYMFSMTTSPPPRPFTLLPTHIHSTTTYYIPPPWHPQTPLLHPTSFTPPNTPTTYHLLHPTSFTPPNTPTTYTLLHPTSYTPPNTPTTKHPYYIPLPWHPHSLQGIQYQYLDTGVSNVNIFKVNVDLKNLPLIFHISSNLQASWKWGRPFKIRLITYYLYMTFLLR